jgi:hypothetical protein
VNNWFDPEQAIAARLAAKLPQVPVKTAHEAAGYAALVGNAPAALVVQYGGYNVADSVPQAAPVAVEQRWYVSVYAREVSDQRGAAGIRAVAGPLLIAVVRALNGYRPAGLPGAGVLVLAGGAPREQIDNGAGVFPLAFALRIAERGQP